MIKNLICGSSDRVVDEILTDSAKDILDRVLAEMQHAEEMGGVKDLSDYILLMTMIAKETMQRISNAAEQVVDRPTAVRVSDA